MRRYVGRFPVGRALWLIKYSVPLSMWLREITLGEAADFVGGGLDPVGSIGAGAELFVLKRSAGGRIDDGVGTAKKRVELRS
jgi:hypothetical protein